MKKLTGRPVLMEGKRSRKIDARFTEEEYQQVDRLAKSLGLKRSDLVRLRLLETSARMLVNGRELLAKLDEVGTELGRAGNNINQLAKYANILQLKGALSPAVVQRLIVVLDGYHRRQEELEKVMRRLLKGT